MKHQELQRTQFELYLALLHTWFLSFHSRYLSCIFAKWRSIETSYLCPTSQSIKCSATGRCLCWLDHQSYKTSVWTCWVPWILTADISRLTRRRFRYAINSVRPVFLLQDVRQQSRRNTNCPSGRNIWRREQQVWFAGSRKIIAIPVQRTWNWSPREV